MSNNKNSIVGKTFKNLKVISYDENCKNSVICLCLLCNKEFSVFKTNVHKKHQYFSCKPCSEIRRQGQNHYNWKGHGQIHGKFMYVLERIAKIRNLECSVTIEYLNDLLIKQHNKCSLSNVGIVLSTEDSKNECTASLDRIDSDKGYIEGNVQWVHKDINKLKTDFSQNRFIELCDMVSSYKMENKK